MTYSLSTQIMLHKTSIRFFEGAISTFKFSNEIKTSQLTAFSHYLSPSFSLCVKKYLNRLCIKSELCSQRWKGKSHIDTFYQDTNSFDKKLPQNYVKRQKLCPSNQELELKPGKHCWRKKVKPVALPGLIHPPCSSLVHDTNKNLLRILLQPTRLLLAM